MEHFSFTVRDSSEVIVISHQVVELATMSMDQAGEELLKFPMIITNFMKKIPCGSMSLQDINLQIQG